MSAPCPKKILIMPEYAPDAYVWDHETCDCISPLSESFSDYPEVAKDVAKIEEELSKWNDFYDRNHSQPNFPLEDFEKQGMSLAKRLAKVVGQCGIEVYYGTGSESVRVTG